MVCSYREKARLKARSFRRKRNPSMIIRVSFALGLSCCALASIAAQAKELLLPLADEATQLKAKILDLQKTEHEFPDVANLPFPKGLPDPFLMPNGKLVSPEVFPVCQPREPAAV